MMHHIKWMHLQDRTKGKVRITNVVSHGYDAVTIRSRIFVQDSCQEIKLFLDSKPGLLPLIACQLNRHGTPNMGLTPLR